MSREVLVIFSSIGVIYGFLLVVYFLFLSKNKTLSERLLGFMFLALTVRIGKSVFFYFTELNEHFIHIGLTASALIGPFLLLYFYSTFERNHRLPLWSYFLLLPAAALYIFSFNVGYRENRELWVDLIQIIRVLWFIYIVLSLFIIIRNRNSKKWLDDRLWYASIFFSVFAVWLAYVTSALTSYIVGALTFSVLMYFLLLIFFTRIRNTAAKRSKRKAAGFTRSDDPFFHSLNTYMTENQSYLNPSLSMPELATALNVTPHFLSQFINDVLDTNFSKFVNYFRIEHATKTIRTKPELSLEAIADESGFHSLSTFYSAFKAIHNMTPSAYRAELNM